jgi:ABC-type multidrug transport system ATPase subunit
VPHRSTPDGELVVHTTGLGKSYGGVVAVADLDLRVRHGEVYGFLGRNGAGKTTTMRMLVGLVRPTAGTATVLGHPAGHPAGLASIGALIESPTLYPHLSGRENLRLLARYAGVPRARVDKVLAEVGMEPRADDRFRAYSLGMKQRLGVAAALLKEPKLLVLDEPTNGLDPAGMADMRDLVRAVAGGGRTVLLSSHLLGEVEHVCDRVGVIQHGRLVAEGTMAELRAASGATLLVGADPADRATVVLRGLPWVRDVGTGADGLLRVSTDPSRAADTNAELVRAGIAVHELRAVERSLEDIFLELTDEPGPHLVGSLR